MTSDLFLQIFLLLNIFLIGALSAIAIQHAYAHFRPHPQDSKKSHPLPQHATLPPEVKERLIQESQGKFQTVLDHSANELQHNLQTTGAQLNKLLEKLGTDIVGDELQRYHDDIKKIRAEAELAIGNAQTEITTHQTDLKAKLAEEIAAEKQQILQQMTEEKQRVIQQIDTKLADAMASFLIETLQHNVDLGAQSAYLTSQLEEHKAEFKRGISDEN